MISPYDPSYPVIFILDQSSIVPKIIKLMLKRHAGVGATVVGFTDPHIAARWLTGTMDKQKAAHPLGTPWDHYPPFTSVTLALVDSEFAHVSGLRFLDWMCDLLPPATPLVTLSPQQICAEELVWSVPVAHLTKPLERNEVIARLSPLLTSDTSS